MPQLGLVHHSDRGSVYASGDYRAALKAFGAVASMSRKGDCWDNAVAESFFATIKGEMIDDRDFETRAEANAAIGDYIDAFYNVTRMHSTIGYVSPIEFELKLKLKSRSSVEDCLRQRGRVRGSSPLSHFTRTRSRLGPTPWRPLAGPSLRSYERRDAMTRDELEADLRTLPDLRKLEVVGNGTLIATVISGSFEGQDEAVRQRTVWSLLRGRHGSHQLHNVEFIFTRAPGDADG